MHGPLRTVNHAKVRGDGYREGSPLYDKQQHLRHLTYKVPCTFMFIGFLVSFCCLTPISHMLAKREELVLQAIGGLLSLMGCLVPCCVLIHVTIGSSILYAFWTGGFHAVGSMCGVLCVLVLCGLLC